MASTPTLRVDTTSPFVVDGNSVSASPSSPKSPSFGTFTRDRARNISQSVLPSFRISSVSDTKSSASGPSVAKQSGAPGASKARNESRKLLSHILSQLQSRPLPPPYLSTLVYGAGQNGKGSGSVIKSVKGAVKYTGTLRERRTHQPLPQDDSDSEDESQEGFSPETTIDLLNQLKDILTVSMVHGWDIFYDRFVLSCCLDQQMQM